MNLWIGFEVVVGGVARASVADMRRHAARVIAVGYPRRLVGDLRANINRLELNLGEALNRRVLEESDRTSALVALCQTICEPVTREDVVASAAASPLLQHRIGSVAETMGSRLAIRRAIDRCEQDVLWHIQRMFRIRSAIVHGGYVPEDIAHVGSHLATYLWAILRVVIEELTREPGVRDVRGVFEKFSWLYEEQLRLLREEPQGDPPFTSLIDPQSLWPS